MATNVFYQTSSNMGVDPTQYYTQVVTAGASVNPELGGPPFQVGMQAFGTDGSQFIFVQASSAINLTDFVAINAGQAAAPFQANSVNTTNIFGSLLIGLGSTGLVLKQSITTIPAGAFFWACTKGTFLPATTSGGNIGTTTNAAGVGNVALFVALTGVGTGIITSLSTTLSPGIAGIVCVNSITVTAGISASIVPPAGTLTGSGLTQGPVVSLNNVRLIMVGTSQTPVSANSANMTTTGGGFAF